MRKTKIVATLGPASSSIEVIRELILAGMNVVRLNFSHGSYEDKLDIIGKVKAARREIGLPIAILLDTKGPEIRIGRFKGDKVALEAGADFMLTTDEILGDKSQCQVLYKDFPKDVSVGSRVLISDGLIELKVTHIDKNHVHLKILNGGVISNNKSINLPGAVISMPYVSERDVEDIKFGVCQGIDFVACSFARRAMDILEIRKLLDSVGATGVKIIAKIENAEGVENIDEIMRVCDGLMIARGDMGVEIPFEEVPVVQKKLIKKAYTAGKQVITATQMLESMVTNPRPTRAEAADVANAIYDGTSAIMLSAETAAGAYPVEAVRTMSIIAARAERDIDYKNRFLALGQRENGDITDAISHATVLTAYDLNAEAIITVTKSGRTARMISRFRPGIKIVSCVMDERTQRQNNLSWGVNPLVLAEQTDTDVLFDQAVKKAEEEGLVKSGDVVVITAGIPLGTSGTTNMLKVHLVGDVLISGKGVNEFSTTANLCIARNEEELRQNFNSGDILCLPFTTSDLVPIIRESSGLIVEEKGANSHAAILGSALDIPVIIGAQGATGILKNGVTVHIDAKKGVVSSPGE